MSGIRAYFRVVTSYHSDCTAENTRYDTFDERFRCPEFVYLRVCNAVEFLNDLLYGVTNSRFLFQIWNMYQFFLPVREVLDRSFYDSFCVLACCLRIKPDKFRFRHLRDR